VSKIVNLDEVRAKLKAAQTAARAAPLTDSERLNVTVDSMKLAYEAILDIYERLDEIERQHTAS
jgi:hypothetical protein